jgi:hypothetical protein
MTPQEYFISKPLYSNVTFSDPEDLTNFKDSVLEYKGSLRTYCHKCDAESIFARTIDPNEPVNYLPPYRRSVSADVFKANKSLLLWVPHNDFFIAEFYCTTGCSNRMIFASYLEEKTCHKIGQYPSYADIFHQVDKKYSKILGKEKYSEFERAVGLASHDIGIGSFVYLRRIFEDLVEEAHIKAKANADWKETLYPSRMQDRILALKPYLPSLLVENRKIYSILSKGIHELDEKECLAYFNLMKEGIEIILEEKLVKQEAEARLKRITGEIAKAVGVLNTQK